MNNVITGGATIKDAKKMKETTLTILSEAGFKLYLWTV